MSDRERGGRVRLPAKLGADVAHLLRTGTQDKMASAAVEEAGKRGGFRTANQGLVDLHGEVVAKCVREAAARYLGGEPPRDARWISKQLMFDAGYTNEDSWFDVLRRAWSGQIKREEEIPIRWETAGIPGSGRPDLVLCDAGGTPVTGLEFKLISSINTAADVMGPQGAPKMDHVCQAAWYALHLGIPWQLWYTNRAVLPVPEWPWVSGKMPRSPQEDATGAVDFSRPSKRYPVPKATKVQPCAVGYHLTWSRGQVYYLRVDDSSGMWTPTVVTERGLTAYWEAAASMLADRELAKRPGNADVHGEEAHFNKCDYCDWRDVCDSVSNYEEWEAEVVSRRLQLESSVKE